LVVYNDLQLYVQAINWQVLEHNEIYQAVAGSFINFDISGTLLFLLKIMEEAITFLNIYMFHRHTEKYFLPIELTKSFTVELNRTKIVRNNLGQICYV
jgi:hypothetical protein